jgi:transcriptional regulator with XRE-family HTH domain
MGRMAAVAKQDPIDALIGERLHTWMWRNRVPQNGFAEALGISQQSLGRKLRGDSAWSAGELARAATTLDVPVGWFFGEAEDVRPKGFEPLTFWFGVCEHDDLALAA